jgi:hypothetical protein
MLCLHAALQLFRLMLPSYAASPLIATCFSPTRSTLRTAAISFAADRDRSRAFRSSACGLCTVTYANALALAYVAAPKARPSLSAAAAKFKRGHVLIVPRGESGERTAAICRGDCVSERVLFRSAASAYTEEHIYGFSERTWQRTFIDEITAHKQTGPSLHQGSQSDVILSGQIIRCALCRRFPS